MTEHINKEDDEGKRVDSARVQVAPNFRLYQPVTQDMLLRVAVKNLSAKPLSFVPVYVDEEGLEQSEDKIDLASGEVRWRVTQERGMGGYLSGWVVWCGRSWRGMYGCGEACWRSSAGLVRGKRGSTCGMSARH